jgi:hypothetical protein
MKKESLDEIKQEIQKGNIRHRRCDVCGCELVMPDIGMFGRMTLNTAICSECSDMKAQSNLLQYVQELRKTKTKQEVIKILDEKMIKTWGEASKFTIEEWEDLMKNTSE